VTIDAVNAGSPRLEDLKKAAQAFESVFAQMLLKSMRSTVKESKLFHGGRGEDVFRDLLDQRYTEGTSNLGVAKLIVERYAKNVST
jgi:Rod binding domain-containing protein